MMDGPGRVKDGIEIQGGELYPHADGDLTGVPGAELHSATKPEKLPASTNPLDTLYP